MLQRASASWVLVLVGLWGCGGGSEQTGDARNAQGSTVLDASKCEGKPVIDIGCLDGEPQRTCVAGKDGEPRWDVTCPSSGDSCDTDSQLVGTWGGAHAELDLSCGGGRLQLDCADGSVGAIKLGANGAFEVSGMFSQGKGGPQSPNDSVSAEAATYKGTVSGSKMHLEITLASGASAGSFDLTRGEAAQLTRCL